MNVLILTATLVIGLIGVGVVAWSFFNTRDKYYSEYVERKRK
jgi:hypothetical protein